MNVKTGAKQPTKQGGLKFSNIVTKEDVNNNNNNNNNNNINSTTKEAKQEATNEIKELKQITVLNWYLKSIEGDVNLLGDIKGPDGKTYVFWTFEALSYNEKSKLVKVGTPSGNRLIKCDRQLMDRHFSENHLANQEAILKSLPVF